MQTLKLSTKNSLGGDNYFLYKSNGKYSFSSLEELYNNSNCSEIHLPSLEPNGEIIWVKLECMNFLGEIKTIKVIPTNGLYFTCGSKIKVPVIVNVLAIKPKKTLQLRLKGIKNMSKLEKLWFYSKIDLNIETGKAEDHIYGFFIGFFLAEGNFIYYSHRIKRESVYSRGALKRWSREKGYKTVDDYLKNRKSKKIKGIQLACGIKDLEKGYIQKIPFSTNVNQYGNSVHVTIYDSEAIDLVCNYVDGSTSKNKYLRQNAFNRSKNFLKGVLDGFLRVMDIRKRQELV